MSELKTLSWTDDHVQQHEPSFEHVRKQTNLAIWINYLPILFKNQYTFVNKNAESKKNKLRFNFVEFWMRQCTGGKKSYIWSFLWREKIKQTWKYISEIVSPLKVSLETKKTKLLWSWKTICLKDGNEQNNFDIYKKRSKNISFIQFSIFIQPKLLIFSLFISSSAKFPFLKQSKVWEKEIVCRLTKSPLKYIVR